MMHVTQMRSATVDSMSLFAAPTTASKEKTAND